MVYESIWKDRLVKDLRALGSDVLTKIIYIAVLVADLLVPKRLQVV